jgi:general stress protein 26
MEATAVREKLIETLRSYDTVMVATTAANGSIHARPMVIAEIEDSGEVWFITSDDAPKIDEARHDARALVTGQEKGRYVSLSGHLDILRDPQRLRTLWKDAWRTWFPEGKADPSLVLLRLRPEIGEYWDERGMRGVRYLFGAARALLDGPGEGDPLRDPSLHAKVPL